MTVFSISDLIADIAVTSNSPTFTSSTRVTTAQVTAWLTQSARALSALYKQKLGQDLDYLQTATLTTVPSFNLVSFPDDCGEVHAVIWAKSSTEHYLLRSVQQGDLELQTDALYGEWKCPPTYRLEGQTLAFYPPSSAAESIILYYATHLDLTGETTFNGRLDADRWLVLDVAHKVNAAKRRDNSVLMQEKLMLEQNLFAPARRRDVNRVNTIRDTRAENVAQMFRSRWRY